MKRLLAITGVALGLMFGATACEDMPPELGQPSYVGDVATTSVYYFGDSLAAMSQQRQRDQYVINGPSVKKWDNTVVGGMFFQNWWPAMRTLPAGATVAVELGTNNILNEAINTGALEQHLIGTFDILRERGVSRTVWFTISEYTAGLKGPNYLTRAKWMNARMADLVATGAYADIGLEIYDWNAIAMPLGASVVSADNLHHNEFGTIVYGCVLYEAVMGPACLTELL